MNTPIVKPSRKEFLQLARRGNLISVFTVVSSDSVTPVIAFQKLQTKGECFLLESAERTGEIGRFSILGRNPIAAIGSWNERVVIKRGSKTTSHTMEGDPLIELKKFMKGFTHVGGENLPVFKGGAVGYLGYDTVRFFERGVSVAKVDQLSLPEMFFMIPGEVVIFDHLTRLLYLICNIEVKSTTPLNKAYTQSVLKIKKIYNQLKAPAKLNLISQQGTKVVEVEVKSNTTKKRFFSMVEATHEYVHAGDAFQVVLSQRFRTSYTGSSLNLYRSLWSVNPSPYMFLMNFEGFSLVGSSPEVHVRIMNGEVNIRPIAGTRKRGQTLEEDKKLEQELLGDPKERAEHVMLIDLARNDVGRVATYGSVAVTESFGIEKFSHVQHIVSNVRGVVREGVDAFDVMRATFPAGTVSGSPKVRAMQIIAKLEGIKRGPYAGAVGYFGFDGNLDTCIALRTVVLRDDMAYVQAGAGVVADSTPEGEFEECRNKARGMMRAIARANQG